MILFLLPKALNPLNPSYSSICGPFFAPPFCSFRRREKLRVAAVAKWAEHVLLQLSFL